jgi:hypothetical protein
MSRENAARRNRALRKIRASNHLPLEIKATIEAILDYLGPKTAYNLAWPSAATIAERTGRSRRTTQWHLQVVRALGFFKCLRFTPDEAARYCREEYGATIRLDRCTAQAPTLFEVNPAHPLWDGSRYLPDDVDRQWGEIAERMKQRRNAKTTSRLSTDPARRLPSRIREIHRTRRFSCMETEAGVGDRGYRVSSGTADGGGPPRINGTARNFS